MSYSIPDDISFNITLEVGNVVPLSGGFWLTTGISGENVTLNRYDISGSFDVSKNDIEAEITGINPLSGNHLYKYKAIRHHIKNAD